MVGKYMVPPNSSRGPVCGDATKPLIDLGAEDKIAGVGLTGADVSPR
jgi:hypothetical protein